MDEVLKIDNVSQFGVSKNPTTPLYNETIKHENFLMKTRL